MKTRRSDLLQLSLKLGIVLFGAYMLSFFFFKLDLTEEKRHTLTDATKTMLGDLDDKVFVRVYLHGEFPSGFKRLERSIKESLDEFRDYSGAQVDYEFIDPYESGDKKTIAETEKTLYEKGLRFTRLTFDENGTQNSKLIWPAAIIEFKGTEFPVQFFRSDMPEPTDDMINSSVNNLEYELASNLRKAMKPEKPAVAVLEGQGELADIEMADFLSTLEENYKLDIVKIDERVNALGDNLGANSGRKNKFQALIVAKPDSLFSDKDRVIIDQFIMNGGKVLWLVDPVLTDLDSLRAKQQTMGISNEMGLYEMLFEYGARLNRNIVIDFQAAPIAFDAGPMGNQRNMQMFSWYYAPLLFPPLNPHPIVANLDPIKLDFASSVDSVNNGNPEIHKIPLLYSSPMSKSLKTPVRISTNIVELGPDYFKENGKPEIMALLMEGQFPSAFKDQLPAQIKSDPNFAFREKSQPTSMIVVADGDVVRNAIINTDQGPRPQALGYDRYAKRVVYDNKEFLLNCMNYLLDDQSIISVRSRTIKLRKLDADAVIEQRASIQIQNTVIPIALVVALGAIQFVVRKRKWSKIPTKQ
jgi:ABC-2 type transport system permease protein